MDSLQQLSVLLIEPHQLMRRIMRDILHDIGVGSVTTATSIDQGLHMLTNIHADAVFVDWSSATDALAFLRQLRRPDSLVAFVPVVVVSPHADSEHVRLARDAGANDYMLKPFSPAAVMKRVSDLLDHPRRFVACESFFGPDRRHHANGWQGHERRQHNAYVERRWHKLPIPGIVERRSREPRPAAKPLPTLTPHTEGATRH